MWELCSPCCSGLHQGPRSHPMGSQASTSGHSPSKKDESKLGKVLLLP